MGDEVILNGSLGIGSMIKRVDGELRYEQGVAVNEYMVKGSLGIDGSFKRF